MMCGEAKKLRSPIVVVLGHVDHGKCIHPDETVLTPNGEGLKLPKLIKGLKPDFRSGDYEVFIKKIPVLTLSPDGSLKTAVAESVWRISYRGPIYKVVLRSGSYVRVTPEHPFLTSRGWVRADQLEMKDLIAELSSNAGIGDFNIHERSYNHANGVEKVSLSSTVQDRRNPARSEVNYASRGEVRFEEVIKIDVNEYEGYLYDLSVPGTQSFIANNIVVHNTTLLDKIRGTAVVSKEPGEMTQHVGASLVPASVIEKVIAPLKHVFPIKLTIPGLLFIDTPGHEAFSNLRRRGGSVADFAILVVDVMEGVKKQTMESVEILMSRKVPFVIAANKIDKIPGWRSHPDLPLTLSLKGQSAQALEELDKRIYTLVGQLSQVNIPSERYDRIKDFRKSIAIVPISAKSGEGIAELLAVLAGIIQRFLTHRIMFTSGPAKGVVLEVKEILGLGHCADAIIYDGILRRGDTVVVGGYEGPIVTKVRALLMPRPLEEMRIAGESGFTNIEEVVAAAGVRISAPEIDKVLAGAPLHVAENEGEVEEYRKRIAEELMQVRFTKNVVGVVVKADTLGTLEAVVSMLENRGVPVRLADVGPLTRREVIEASIVAKENRYLGVVLLFNVKAPPDIEELAVSEGVKIFKGNIIYKLIEEYENWVAEEKAKESYRKALEVVFPAKFQVLPGYVFRRSNPAIVGVKVLGGTIRPGYRIMRADGKPLGKIHQIQLKGKTLHEARSGAEVAISIEGDVLVGRHLDEGDVIYTDPTEDDLITFITDFKNEVTKETVDLIKEIIKIKQNEDRRFGLSVLMKLRGI
ncbi:MAG: translation initiation factor IF-2 [Zestosphaera sp.]